MSFRWDERAVFEALECIHPGPDKWVIVPGVPDATSFDRVRTCDAMAFGCWKSQGIAVHGYEIKVSRSDWLRELQQPEKSQGFIRKCNYWWIAAPDGVVKLEELPATWGLRIVSRSAEGNLSVRVKKAATFNPSPSWGVDFIVALARVCYRKSPDRLANEADIKAAYDRGHADGVKSAERLPYDQEFVKRELEELRAKVDAFEAATGVDLRWADSQKAARAVNVFKQFQQDWNGLKSVFDGIEGLTELADELAGLVGFVKPEPRKKRGKRG